MRTMEPLQQSRTAFLEQLDAPAPDTAVMQIQSRVLEAIARGYPLDDVLSEICFLVETARRGGLCSILLLDAERKALHPGVGPSLPAAVLSALEGLPAANNSGSCGTAAFTGKLQVVEDTQTDPRWAAPAMKSLAQQYGVKSCWSIPFFAGNGETLGTFAISQVENACPSEGDLSLLKTAAHLASIAVERARMEAELKATHARLRGILGGNGGASGHAIEDARQDAMKKLSAAREILDRLPA